MGSEELDSDDDEDGEIMAKILNREDGKPIFNFPFKIRRGKFRGVYKIHHEEWINPPCCKEIFHLNCIRGWTNTQQFGQGAKEMLSGANVAANKQCPYCRQLLVLTPVTKDQNGFVKIKVAERKTIPKKKRKVGKKRSSSLW